MNKRAIGLVAFIALAGVLALAGAGLLLTSFKVYDDEGYVLLSLLNFSHGGRLYTDIYTQYGPFFYWWSDALCSLLRFDFSHVAARSLTLFYWLGAALACAGLVDRCTRSIRWALVALALTFAHLWQITAEPMHPGGLISFLVALGAWAGAECIARENGRSLAIVVGALGAALALTKINIGLFFFAGAGAWLLLQAREPFLWRHAGWLAAAALAALPWALMHALLGQPWVVTFASIAASSAVSIVLVSQSTRRKWFAARHGLPLLAAALVLTALIASLSLLRGGSLADLVEGVVRGPLRHPGVYFFAVVWRAYALPVSLVSLALCAVAHARGWTTAPAFLRANAGMRLLALGLTGLAWFDCLPVNALGLTISYAPALAAWLVMPLSAEAGARQAARLRSWIALLAITQMLHAYPIGGSQIGWGTFLFPALLVLAAAEAVTYLFPSPAVARPSSALRPQSRTTVTALLTLLTTFGLAAHFLQISWQRWRASEPLRLPGAEIMRLPELFSARLRAITLNAGIHGGELFSLPGLFSFNLWSGRPTPTLANVTHWFSLLNSSQQNAIAARLAADPRAVIVVEPSLVDFIRQAGLPVAGPLYDAIRHDFAPAMSAGNYQLWVKRGRTLAAFSTAQLYSASASDAEKFQLRVCVYTPPGSQVASVDWVDCSNETATHVVHVLDGKNSRLAVTPLSPAGAAIGTVVQPAYPAPLPPFAQLTFFSNDALDSLPRASAVLRVRDAHGALISEAIFAD